MSNDKSLNIYCKHLRRLFDKGQYWCAENHDIFHCDETCPFRAETIIDNNDSIRVPHNIYSINTL